MSGGEPSISNIRVGMTASLSGRYAYPGKQALAGAQAWARWVNRAGGIAMGDARFQVELVHYDDESSPQRCRTLTQRLIESDDVSVLLGPYSSGLARSAARVAAEHGRVLWNHGGALGSQAQGTAVDILSPASTYFHGVIGYALCRMPELRRVAVVHSTAGEFPRQVASGALEHFEGLRLPPPTVITYAVNSAKAIESIIERLRKDPPDLLLGVGRIEDDVELARQLHHARLNIEFVALIAAPLACFGEDLGDAAEGILGPSQWEPGVLFSLDYGPSEADVIGQLADVGQRVVDYPAAQAYAGCLVAQRCIEEAGSLNAQALWAAASRLDFTTFYGRFRINALTGRQEGHTMPVIQWRGGHKALVWTPQSGLV